jgi:hypothetical protein
LVNLDQFGNFIDWQQVIVAAITLIAKDVEEAWAEPAILASINRNNILYLN